MQLVGGLLHGRARLQAPGRVETMAAVIGVGRIHLKRRPELRRLGAAIVGRQDESRRHDADDLERVAVDENGSPDDRCIRRVAPMPEGVPEHDQSRTIRQVLLGGERSADHRRDAKRRERVRADTSDGDAFGLLIAGEVHLTFTPRGHLLQRPAALPIVHDLALGDPGFVERRPLAPDHHRAVRLGPWQGLEEHRVEDAEDRGIGANPERERQDGNRGESRIPEERPRPESKVLPECLEESLLEHTVIRVIRVP